MDSDVLSPYLTAVDAALHAAGNDCERCRVMARECLECADTVSFHPVDGAIDHRDGRVSVKGLLHRFGPVYRERMGKTNFGYAGSCEGRCDACDGRWWYQGDYHLGMGSGVFRWDDPAS